MHRPATAAAAIFALASLAALPAPGGAATGPWFETPQGRVRLVSGRAVAAPDGDPALGVEFALAPGWHVYWRNAGDAGYPPELGSVEGSSLAAATLRFPAPSRFELPGDLVAFGYEHEVIYPLDARLAAAPGASAAPLRLRLDYLVCAETCIPYTADLALELPLGAAADDAEIAPRLAAWRSRLPLAAGGPGAPAVDARLESDEASALALVVTFAGDGLVAVAPDLFFDTHRLLAIGRPTFVASAAGPAFRVPLRPLDASKPLPDRIEVDWTATGFESEARPVAFEGRLSLDRPADAVPAAIAPRVALAVAAVAVVFFVLARARRARPVEP